MLPTPYVASLRIYEPLQAFAPSDQLRWKSLTQSLSSSKEEQIRALIRTIHPEPPQLRADGAHILDIDGERYVYQPEKGIRPWQPDDPSHWPVLEGSALRAMAQGDFSGSETLSQSKQLMRFLLSIHLQDQTLTTRQILIDLKKI